jgi:hypothetical protein
MNWLIVSLNLHRRQLYETERGMVAEKIAETSRGGDRKSQIKPPMGDLKHGDTKDGGRLTRREAATLLNVGTKTLDRARVVRSKAAQTGRRRATRCLRPARPRCTRSRLRRGA